MTLGAPDFYYNYRNYYLYPMIHFLENCQNWTENFNVNTEVLGDSLYFIGETWNWISVFSQTQDAVYHTRNIVLNDRTEALTTQTAKAGDKIRLHDRNGGVAKISSLHFIGEIFDRIYPESATNLNLRRVQTTLIPAGGAKIMDLQLDEPGKTILVDHA